jgi:hypothetical protein
LQALADALRLHANNFEFTISADDYPAFAAACADRSLAVAEHKSIFFVEKDVAGVNLLWDS